jgi:2-dehydropantoate 2-reductase
LKILIVGAGGIGGYFGARLLDAGRDVTFLVRERRARILALEGLKITSPVGDLTIRKPPTITAQNLRDRFDLVLLSCKAYDLDQAIIDFSPAVGADTLILPLLNGMKHLEILEGKFGRTRVLGGLCMISTVLAEDGTVRHLSEKHELTLGARYQSQAHGFMGVVSALASAGFDLRTDDDINQAMWEKWVFIAAGAALTSLMRAPVGDIVEGGGSDLAEELVRECADIAGACGYPPSEAAVARTLAMFTETGSKLSASLFRDIEAGGRIESEHLVGDLLQRAPSVDPFSLLSVSYLHMKVYEARRTREAAG